MTEGYTFNLADITTNKSDQKMTASEKISNLLENLNDIVIKEENKEEDFYAQSEMDTIDKIKGNSESTSFADSMTFSLHNADINDTTKFKSYGININDKDIYYPLKGEKESSTRITSDEVTEPVMILDEFSVTESREIKLLNSDKVINLDFSEPDIVDDDELDLERSQDDVREKTNRDTDVFKRFVDVNSNVSSNDIFSSLGIDTSSTANIVKNNHLKRDIRKSVKEDVSSTKTENVDSKVNNNKRRQNAFKLKEQDPQNMINDSEEFGKIDKIVINNTDNQRKLKELFNSVEKSNQDMTNDIKSQSIRTVGLINSLDSIITDVNVKKTVSPDSIAKSIITQLNDEISVSGKRYISVQRDTVSAEVRDILIKDSHSISGIKENIEIIYPMNRSGNSDYLIVAYKEIPSQYRISRNRVLQPILLKLKDTLLRTNKSCKITGSSSLQGPITFDFSSNGISSLTNTEIRLIISKIENNYIYEIQNNTILIWGVK